MNTRINTPTSLLKPFYRLACISMLCAIVFSAQAADRIVGSMSVTDGDGICPEEYSIVTVAQLVDVLKPSSFCVPPGTPSDQKLRLGPRGSVYQKSGGGCVVATFDNSRLDYTLCNKQSQLEPRYISSYDIEVFYHNEPGNADAWIGIYAPGKVPAKDSSFSWQKVDPKNVNQGSVTFDFNAFKNAPKDSLVYLFKADNGQYQILDGPAAIAPVDVGECCTNSWITNCAVGLCNQGDNTTGSGGCVLGCFAGYGICQASSWGC